jgi:hypothetical protein
MGVLVIYYKGIRDAWERTGVWVPANACNDRWDKLFSLSNDNSTHNIWQTASQNRYDSTVTVGEGADLHNFRSYTLPILGGVVITAEEESKVSTFLIIHGIIGLYH